MTEFFNVLPPDKAQALMLEHLTNILQDEIIETVNALNRVTASELLSPHPLPAFRRSTMDGYAVHAADTYGASGSLPALLNVIGEVPMGESAAVTLERGQAVIVHTGGMIPEMVDAVVQIELTQLIGSSDQELPHSTSSVHAQTASLEQTAFEIEVFKAVASGENVLQIGEDVQVKSEVLSQGHLLRPQDLGGLLALGITSVAVVRQPIVAILATGDEVVSPYQEAGPGQIRDINSYTVAGQVVQAGGIPVVHGIIPDSFDDLLSAAQKALEKSDMLVMSAGSSVSVRDMTVQVIEQLGTPGVLFHGVATRPGKPTIVGVVNSKPVLGLPGNPVSAMIQFDMFGTLAIHHLQGLKTTPRRGLVWARLSQNIASQSGREDYIPARLGEGADGLTATPIFGKSNLIYTLVKADGLIKVPLNKGGLLAGEQVEVRLY